MNVCYDKGKNRVVINSDKNSPFPKGLTCYDVKSALSVFQNDTPVYIPNLASDSDNEVWYNFYLAFTGEDIQLTFTCNNGEKDDWATYQLPMADYEKLCMWKRLPRFFFEVISNM